MKKLSIIAIPLVLLFMIGLVSYIWYNNAISAPTANGEEKRVVIPKGASSEKIANTLQEAGVIKNAFAFRLYTQLNNQTRNIPAGQFDVPQNLSVAEVLKVLAQGPAQIWLTIPEGLRREEIPDKLLETLELDEKQADAFRQEFIQASEGMEGYLFPDTYLFPPEVDAAAIVKTMRSTFDVKFPEPERAKLKKLDLTLDEAVTLASMLERETLTKEERPVVAGIFMNRLNLGMPLQVDATVQYAVSLECQLSSAIRDCEWWPKNLTREQIQNTNSPYNTYIHTGIPPAPIANPGLTSLMAIANPEDNDYLYYIHDSSGQIHYAKDLDEHNENIRNYLH